ncbi:Type II secretory pathway, component ExeA (predicted ATPase) [Singulisphaera sp. GP187]|uniref:ExeA family protein n=1 Tax=Singulisphaera sp. GP187 TaxID=1882752 RepID=UPI00092C449E|nr:type II secretory pathway protein ExeA [Singulisphaera sp. GP187]SIO67569.1 Type II secretory pathway, component ExeA (predicted ATPase) [Singulisphaera sp. GP187]
MWKRYWKLSRDPFDARSSPFVPLEAHQEAVARLVETIESGRKLAILQEKEGMGKSRVLAQALGEVRGPGRRIARISSPVDGVSLFSELAEALGAPVPAGASRGAAWKRLGEALRLCRWQRLQVILAIDDCQDLPDPTDRLDLDRLVHADSHPAARLSVIQVFRSSEDDERTLDPWGLSIALPALMRTESERYITTKLAVAGRDEPIFTPRAVHRLHSLTEGVPRSLDRLASLALMAGAMRGLEIIPPEVVEGVSAECRRSAFCA